MNPKKFIRALVDYYGTKFTNSYGSGHDENGELSRVWQNAIEQFSNCVAGKVMAVIMDGETEFTRFPPTPGELKQLFKIQCDKLIGAPKRAEAAKLALENTNKIHASGLHDGVPRGFGKYQSDVDAKHEKLDEQVPGWRDEAMQIMKNDGAKAYCKFMLEGVFKVENPVVTRA